MPTLDSLVGKARELGASDIHLEGGLPAGMRVQGDLRMVGEPIPTSVLASFAHELLGPEGWSVFEQQKSLDLSRPIQGIRCRINVLQSARGVGLAIRLLSSFQSTLASLNLHPDLKRIVEAKHGLVMVSGPTGSGKSATLAALLQEINLVETRHIVTIESPIEYVLVPRQSLIRQRQVGRDTPSFEHALLDALREDPDVLMVGEMRDPETMRLTLNAAETGHLVLTTLHSASAAEALGRVVAAFPAEIQPSVCAQIADCLVAVICQRLRYRPDLRMRIPECEILRASSGVRGTIRAGQFTRLATALESGGNDGQWTFSRYRAWADARTDWAMPAERTPLVLEEELPIVPSAMPAPERPGEARRSAPPKPKTKAREAPLPAPQPPAPADNVLVIDEIDEDPAAILERMKKDS
jgi:twitching motility protein PilT